MSDKERKEIKKIRKKRAKQLRRDIIIDTATQAFIKQGYENAMVDEIATEAGYTKASLYNYFESKEELFVAVVTRVFERLHQTLTEYLARTDVEYELRSMGDAYLLFVEKNPDQAVLFEAPRLSLVIGGIIQKEQTGEDLSESEKEFRDVQLKVQDLMTSVITATMEKTGIKNEVDPFAVIMALTTMDNSIRELVVRGMRENESKEKTRAYLDTLFTIIDSGLRHYGK